MAKTWSCGRCSAENEESAVSCRTCGAIRGGVIASPNPIAPGGPANPGAPIAPPPAGASSSWAAPASSATAGAPQAAATEAPPLPIVDAAAPGGWPGAPVAQADASPKAKGKTRLRTRVLAIVAFILVGGAISWYTTAERDSSGQINHAGDLAVSELRVGDCYDLPGDSPSFDPNKAIEKTNAKPCTDPHHYEVFFTGKMPDSATYPTENDFKTWTNDNCIPAYGTYVGTPYDQSSLDLYWFYPAEEGWGKGDRGIQCSLADPNLKALTKSLKGSGY